MSKIPCLYLILCFFLGCVSHQRNPQPSSSPLNAPFLQWPVKKARLTQKFKKGFSPFTRHEGIDLASAYGSSILAAHKGRVIFAGRKYRGYGKMIILEYNKTWASLYGHLSRIYVKKGDWVKKGRVIGAMGNSGKSSGVHLHFELLKEKVPVDPLKYLK